MKSRKKFFSFISNKKKAGLLVMLMLCVGVYAAVGGISKDKAVDEEIPLHDGDVLVDSLNVKEQNNNGQETNVDESALVTSDDVSDLENDDTYFQELRATLEMDRNKIISMLSDTESSASSSAEKKEASEEKMRLLHYMEEEKTIETLIKNKGLPDCFVVITENGVNITVNTEDLDQATVTKICEIVMRQTDRPADEIVVQEVS